MFGQRYGHWFYCYSYASLPCQVQVTYGGPRNASRPIVEATMPNSDDDSILGINRSNKSQITGEFTDSIGVSG